VNPHDATPILNQEEAPMPRSREAIRCDDQVLHVYNRGVDRGTIFFCESDYNYFKDLLARYAKPEEIKIFSFSLMPNHFHLLLWQKKGYDVSRFMRKVSSMYARYLNKNRGRTGHLYQGRYGADPVDDPASILRVSWYIHQNPVEAKLADQPEQWKHGSMREYAGLVRPYFTSLTQISELVGGLANYQKFMREYDRSAPGSAGDFLV
jgi:putative transposase